MGMNLEEVGARVGIGSEDKLELGIYLPNITNSKGYELKAQIIHGKDQFDPSMPANEVSLNFIGGPYGLCRCTRIFSFKKSPLSSVREIQK